MKNAQYIQKLNGIGDWVLNTVLAGLRDMGEEVVDMNIAQMEEEGVESRGNKIKNPHTGSTKYADPAYVEYKSMLGKETRFINLNLSGDFHSSMDFKMHKDGMSITAKDPKTNKLIGNYGVDIFGLTEDNFDEIVDRLEDYLYNELNNYFS